MLVSNGVPRIFACAVLMALVQFHSAVVMSQGSSTASRNAVFTAIVSDPSGAVIPNAEISFHGETDVTIKTAEDGSAHVLLPYGSYVVTISSLGFKTTKISDVQLDTEKPAVLKIELQLRSTGEHGVYVEGIQTITSDVPNVIAPDRVPDAATALRIAERALSKVYGKREIDSERPLTATLENGIWTVYGTLCCPDRKGHRTCEVGKCLGGVAVLKVRQSDGKILSISHSK